MTSGLKSSLTFFVVVILFVVGVQFNRMIIEKDYLLYSHTECDPTAESCFVQDCEESEDGCDLTPYKKIEKLAKNAPDCDLSKPECINLSCAVDEDSCTVTSCSEDVLEEGETCTETMVDEIVETP
ncbi:MAG: hypothetical protein AB200_00880 [Parcubacteria bacterium C7867-005]|nr:MAG: hypothetical protein AB200_00880 [Parcubacteria bacterium C7867-005]